MLDGFVLEQVLPANGDHLGILVDDKNKNINKHVKIWYAIGRIAFGCFISLCVALIFDIQGWLEWLLCGIGTLFACISLHGGGGYWTCS